MLPCPFCIPSLLQFSVAYRHTRATCKRVIQQGILQPARCQHAGSSKNFMLASILQECIAILASRWRGIACMLASMHGHPSCKASYRHYCSLLAHVCFVSRLCGPFSALIHLIPCRRDSSGFQAQQICRLLCRTVPRSSVVALACQAGRGLGMTCQGNHPGNGSCCCELLSCAWRTYKTPCLFCMEDA